MLQGNKAEEGSHLSLGCHIQHGLILAKGPGIIVHLVAPSCISSAFPVL